MELLPNYFFHCIFVVDALMHMIFVPAKRNKIGKWQLKRRKIFKHYMKARFVPDLIGFLPFHLIDNRLLFFELIRLIYLPRVGDLLLKGLHFLVALIYKKASKVFTIYSTASFVLTFCIWLITITHLFTDFYIFISSFPEFVNGKRLETWLIQRKENQLEYGKAYLDSLYFVFASLIKMGLANIEITTSWQMLTIMFMDLVGTLTISYAVFTTEFFHKRSVSIIPILKKVSDFLWIFNAL